MQKKSKGTPRPCAPFTWRLNKEKLGIPTHSPPAAEGKNRARYLPCGHALAKKVQKSRRLGIDRVLNACYTDVNLSYP